MLIGDSGDLSKRLGVVAALIGLAVSACTPGGSGANQPGAPGTAARTPERTLIAVERNEPKTLALRSLAGQSFEGFGTPVRLVNSDLAVVDDRDTTQPYLAEALPKLNTDTWRVFPDGRMETTWKLKPNLTWHDGAPLSARDFVFGWQVYSKQEFGTSSAPPFKAIEDVAAPDDRNVVVRWRQPFPEAGQLTGSNRNLPALPRHLLETPLQELDPAAFVSSSYWTRDYVGLGPYRMDQWEPGAFVEGVAFAEHALGRPKISRVRVRFIGDQNAAMTAILAGEVHFVDSAITPEQAVQLQREWASQGQGSIAWEPNLVRAAFFQRRPELATPQAILDTRVRKALAHTVDKQSIADTIYHGVYTPADFMVLPSSEWGPALIGAVQQYPYDPRRSEQLMNEAGFLKRNDGFFSSPGERLEAEVRYTQGFAEDTLAMVSDWRKVGFELQSMVVPTAAALDPAMRVAYPGMYVASTPHGANNLGNYTTTQIPRAENNWRGGNNRGGWSNPEFDRLVQAFDTTLEPAQRATLMTQIARVFTDDLPMVPFVFVRQPFVWVAALGGITPEAIDNDITWNIHQWELR